MAQWTDYKHLNKKNVDFFLLYVSPIGYYKNIAESINFTIWLCEVCLSLLVKDIIYL